MGDQNSKLMKVSIEMTMTQKQLLRQAKKMADESKSLERKIKKALQDGDVE